MVSAPDPSNNVPPLFRRSDILVRNVLTFLSARELCQFSCSSRFCATAASSNELWKSLLEYDFVLPTFDAQNQSSTGTKVKYKTMRGEIYGRISQAKETQQRRRADDQMEGRLVRLQQFLDFSQFRLLTVIPALGLFISLILFALHYDGARVSIWACIGPLFFVMFYIFLSIIISFYIHSQHGSLSSPIRSYWQMMKSPIAFFYETFLKHSKGITAVSIAAYILICAQLAFIGIKLSGDVSSAVREDFSWGLVFLPIWVLSVLFCAFPLIAPVNGAFVAAAILLWMPFVILFACLSVKLDDEKASNKPNLDLEIILMPFWVIEGLFLAGATGFLAVGYRRFTDIYAKSTLY
jgi:hypothetical protein